MISIHDYNPNWPKEFEAIKSQLLATLGPLALRIDHIGSTSVPGLGAKDVIDIQVTAKELVPEIAEKMIAAGYIQKPHLRDHVPLGEDDNPELWKKMVFVDSIDQRRTNIHFRIEGNPNQRYALVFRDYLRAHPNSMRSIELVKRQIAKYHADSIEAYLDIKDPVYDLIWDAAQEWAKQTNWASI